MLRFIREWLFVRWMAERYREKAGVSRQVSLHCAKTAFLGPGGYREDMRAERHADWSRAAARELVDIDMSYWSD